MKTNEIVFPISYIQKSTYLQPDRKADKDFNRILNNVIKDKDKDKLYESCQELESVFFYKVLESMKASIPRSDLINRGFATETFESMLYEEYSKIAAKNGALGLADIMYRQLLANMEGQ